MTSLGRTTTTVGEAAAVTGICFGLPIVWSLQAVASGFSGGEFSDNSSLGLVATELVLGAAALWLLTIRRYAVVSLLPTPTIRGSAVGIGLFFVAWLAGWLVVSPFSAGQAAQPIEQMVREATLTLPANVLMAMVNGTYEEVFLLGFLVRGLRGWGLSSALGTMLLVRVMYHLYQGPIGALWVFGIGLTFGVYYVRSGNLWPPVFAHVLWDIVPFVFRGT